MQVSLSTACLYIYPLRQTFEIAKRAGFDGVELVIGPEVDWRGGKYVRRLSEEFSLPVLTVHPPLFGFPGWSKISTSIQPYFKKAVRVTREVGAPFLVVHMPLARSFGSAIGRGFVQTLTSAREQLNGAGPQFAMENGSKFRERDASYILRMLPDLRAFADAHDFRMTLDTAHVGTWGLDLLDSIKYFDGRLVNVHLSDLREVPGWVLKRAWLHSYLRQHQLPGAGFLPLKEFLHTLYARGYRGSITYELSPVALEIWSPRRAEQTLRACVEFVRKNFR